MDIHNKRILITGSSKGIGKALAERFAKEGAQVALVARSADTIEALAKTLGGKAYPADLTNLDDVTALIERVEADGPIDILINNAGISYCNWAPHHSAQDIEAIFRTNLLAPVHLCNQLIPRMLARGGGHIVNMSSLAAVLTPPGLVHYGASKAGLSHYTAGLRQDLRDLPIGLTLVQIGSVDTDLDDETRAYPPFKEFLGDKPPSDRTDMSVLIDGIVEAIRHNKRHVRYPKAIAFLPAIVEIPRRLSEAMFKKIKLNPL